MSNARLAFLRHPTEGGRSWSGARWITPGPTRTVSFYNVEEETLPSEITRQLIGGDDFTPAEYAATTPANVRPANMSSGFISSPYPFQSYFKVHWEDMFGARANLADGARSLSPLANPNARGAATGQPLQAYNPWPSAGELSPTFPGAELKAL